MESAGLTPALVNENADLVKENAKYIMRITGDEQEGKTELNNFIDPQSRYPVIACTSKLMSTGVDAQTCKLIVLDQSIKSMTEFKQIVGRGTRINEAYGKFYFTIIDLFAGRDTPQVKYLEQAVLDGADIALCGIILTEILQGIRDDRQHRQVRQHLKPLLMLPIEEEAFVLAAELFRELRKQGLTIRKTNDCIIAATAIAHGIPLLHNDRDFETLAQHTTLETIVV